MTTQVPSVSGPVVPARINPQGEIHDLLVSRRSPRAFSAQPVAPALLTALFEAARWSPSSANEQPWHFIVASKEDASYATLFRALTEKNQRWAGKAPLLVVALAQTTYRKSGTRYGHAWYDLGQSVAHLTVQAGSLGLAVHQMGGFDEVRLAEEFPVPPGFDPVVIFAVGYPGGIGDLPEDLQERENAPRTRRTLESFLFTDRWGEPSRHLRAEDPRNDKPHTSQ